jgi:hypothetical protein
MTAFNKNNIPTSVNTLEKLVVWSGLALHTLNKTGTAVEGTTVAARVAQFGIFNVESSNTIRAILRQSVELNDDYAFDGKPVWENVKNLSEDVIPAEFLPTV